MSTIKRTCILCERETILVSPSFGQGAGWAAATCPVICADCADAFPVQDDPHYSLPYIVFQGAHFALIGGAYVGPRGFQPQRPPSLGPSISPAPLR